MNTVIVVQARTGSSRLPRKVLLPLAERPLLQRMVERVQAASNATNVIVATTTLGEDDAVARLCETIGVDVYRGHPTDLLDRHVRAALSRHADCVVKIPSDCPLIDPHVIDRVVNRFIDEAGAFDYVSNLHPGTYPDGNDVEVLSIDALVYAWRHADHAYEREHTTPFVLNHPEMFAIGNVVSEHGRDLSQSHRWVVDYPEDYLLVREVYHGLWSALHPQFSMSDIIRWLEEHPMVARTNAIHAGESWWNRVPELAAVPWAGGGHKRAALHASH